MSLTELLLSDEFKEANPNFEEYYKGFREGFENGYSQAKEDYKPVEGYWVPVTVCQVYQCTACNAGMMTNRIDLHKYCPTCGAKMLGVKHDRKG